MRLGTGNDGRRATEGDEVRVTVTDTAAFVAAARAIAETVGFATSTKELTIDARRRILTAMTAFLESK